MNEPSHQLRQETREETSVAPLAEQHQETTSATEFASVDEMIRHDAAGTKVPAAVTDRVRRAVAGEGARPAGSWWRRFFGETNL